MILRFQLISHSSPRRWNHWTSTRSSSPVAAIDGYSLILRSRAGRRSFSMKSSRLGIVRGMNVCQAECNSSRCFTSEQCQILNTISTKIWASLIRRFCEEAHKAFAFGQDLICCWLGRLPWIRCVRISLVAPAILVRAQEHQDNAIYSKIIPNAAR